MIAIGFDLRDFGINPRRLFTLSDRDLIFNALESLSASFFVYIGNDILREVENTVKVATRNIKQHAQIRGYATRVPDVCNRCSKSDMSHALTAYSRARYFHAALIADDSFITGVFIFAAVTLPVTLWTKNGFAEQAILFRSQAAVVDGFRLEHFTI